MSLKQTCASQDGPLSTCVLGPCREDRGELGGLGGGVQSLFWICSPGQVHLVPFGAHLEPGMGSEALGAEWPGDAEPLGPSPKLMACGRAGGVGRSGQGGLQEEQTGLPQGSCPLNNGTNSWKGGVEKGSEVQSELDGESAVIDL